MEIKSTYKDQGLTYLVEIEISATELNNEYNSLLKKYSSSVNLPGFRKGKVPLNIVEKRFGEELSQSVLEKTIPKAIKEALNSHSLSTIGPAEFEKDHPPLKYESNQPLALRLIFNKTPRCEIKSYDGLSITKNKYRIEDGDIEQNKKRILDSLGKDIEVDDKPQYGDMIHLDLVFKHQNLSHLNLKNHIVMFDKDDPTVYPDYLTPLHEIIMKMKKGDSQEIEFSFPQKVKEESLRGRKEGMHLTINRIKRFLPAEMSQETLQKLQIKSEDELNEKIKKEMEAYAQNQAEKQVYEEAISALTKNTAFEIPEIAVDYYLQSSWNQLAEELKMRGQKNVPENPSKAWKEENYPWVRKKIEADLVITQVKEKEKIQVGEDEIEGKIKEMAESSKMELKEYRKELIKSGGFTELKKQLVHRKTLDWILAKCTVSEEKEYPFNKLNETQKHHH